MSGTKLFVIVHENLGLQQVIKRRYVDEAELRVGICFICQRIKQLETSTSMWKEEMMIKKKMK